MIYFRADANEKIGLGHTMRCLALADAFRSGGEMCSFIIASDSGSASIIEKRGYSVFRLQSTYLQMEEETKELKELLSDDEILYLVDSYFVPDGYYERIKQIIAGRGRVVCFDDMIDKAFPADGVINYNLYADAGKYEALYRKAGLPVPSLYLGGDFVPVRTVTEELPPELAIRRRKAGEKHVLLSCGGADPEKVTVKFLQYLREKNNPGEDAFIFHIPVGAVNAAAGEIRELADGLENVVLYRHIQAFRAFMRQMDFAVSAAGSTLYELCMEGIPTVTYVLADNQKEIAAEFARRGLMRYAGDCRNNDRFVSDVMQLLRDLSAGNNPDECKTIMRNAVDGLGADRLAEVLLKDNRG